MRNPAVKNCLFLLAAVLAGCTGRTETPADGRTFTDDLGRAVTVRQPVERLVTLAPNLTELVFAAGAGAKVVGVSTVDDYPPAVADLPRYGIFPVDFEAIAALDPQLVLATSHVNVTRDADTFAALGIPTFFLSFRTLDDVLDGLRRTGEVLGTRATAEAAADSLTRVLASLRARTDTVSARPLVLFLIGDAELFAFGKESYIHEMIHLAGGRSATEDFTTEEPVLSESFVLSTAPDVIIGGFGPDYDTGRLLELHPTWNVVPAVRDGRVHTLDGNLFYRPGPRLVEGTLRMARLLHPALFVQDAGGSEPDATP
jgi:iron complex transport system substrate-binding protein